MEAFSLVPDIDAYLEATGQTATAFGRAATGDPSFVFDLRKGRRCWPETEAKVRAYMAANPPAPPAAPVPQPGAEAA